MRFSYGMGSECGCKWSGIMYSIELAITVFISTSTVCFKSFNVNSFLFHLDVKLLSHEHLDTFPLLDFRIGLFVDGTERLAEVDVSSQSSAEYNRRQETSLFGNLNNNFSAPDQSQIINTISFYLFMQLFRVNLFNQFFVMIPLSIFGHFFLEYKSNSPPVRELPTFHRLVIDFFILVPIQEIGVYYTHR